MKKIISTDGPSQISHILDTTKHSLLHRIFKPFLIKYNHPHLLKMIVYASAVAATLLPLVVIALYDLPTLTERSKNLKLPFLYDLNMFFMFIISFPLLVIYFFTDQSCLLEAIRKIIRENILHISITKAKYLENSWTSHFNKFNIVYQTIGIVIGLVAAYLNYIMWSNPKVGFWILKDGRFSLTGWFYLYCIFLFFYIAIFYSLRIFAESLFLRDLVRNSEVRLEAFHPDGCGGLSPVGKIGLRHQYILTILGINLLIFYFYNVKLLDKSFAINMVIILLVIGYITVGPLVFFSPLIPFRKAMKTYKSNLIKDFSLRLQEELYKFHSNLHEQELSKKHGEVIETLRNIITFVQELPVWPFDTRTVRKFAIAYIAPAGSLIIPLFKMLQNYLTNLKINI